jgi:hypothetical protein
LTENTSPDIQAKIDACMKGGKSKEECLKMINEEKAPAAEAKAEADAMNLTKRIESVIKDVLDAKLKALELNMDAKIDAILKSKEIEMEQALRKGFGLEQDPVIHQSDLINAIRKAQLEANPKDKKTEASLSKAGPEGNSKPQGTPIDAVFDSFGGQA